jgi:putative copper export protein
LSLAVLVVTGLVQMVLNPNYGGMLSFANTWSAAIFAKHLAIGGMIAIAGFQTWVLQPQIRKAIILQAASKAENESIEVTSRFKRFSRVNLILGVIVLGFTALARASL